MTDEKALDIYQNSDKYSVDVIMQADEIAYDALRERIERNNVTTNAEKIRAMSDEEIAAFACLNAAVFTPCDIICNGDCKAYASFGCTSEDACKKIVLNWLKQPCKEDK